MGKIGYIEGLIGDKNSDYGDKFCDLLSQDKSLVNYLKNDKIDNFARSVNSSQVLNVDKLKLNAYKFYFRFVFSFNISDCEDIHSLSPSLIFSLFQGVIVRDINKYKSACMKGIKSSKYFNKNSNIDFYFSSAPHPKSLEFSFDEKGGCGSGIELLTIRHEFCVIPKGYNFNVGKMERDYPSVQELSNGNMWSLAGKVD